jgi:hypothetical protein
MSATAIPGAGDLFERGEGRREGAAAESGGDVRQDDPSS